LENRKLNEPGTVFEYNDVRVNLLAYSLLQVWKTIARDKEKLWIPLVLRLPGVGMDMKTRL
jgi:hypothetical protein